MFMPNKIKKSWNFKESFDFAKPQKKIQENARNLKKVLDNLRPQTNYQLRDIKSSQSRLSTGGEDQLIKEHPTLSQGEEEDPFKITSYDGGFKKYSPFIQIQREQTPNSTRYEYMIGTINEDESKMQDLIILNNSPHKQQTSIKGSFNSQKDIHLYNSNNIQKIKKHQSDQNPLQPRRLIQTSPGKQLPTQNSKEYFNQTSHSKPFVPYMEQQKNNDLVYSGGFLLKPRSKYQSHDYYSKKNSIKNKLPDSQRMSSSGSTNIIQVKSLDTVIKQRQQLMAKTKSEKNLHYNFDLPGSQRGYRAPLKKDSNKTNENITKTLRYLQQLQTSQRPPSNQEHLFGLNSRQGMINQQQQVGSPKQTSSKSKKPMTRSDMEASPLVFQYPIQKVLIKHKDGSMEYSQVTKDPSKKVKEMNEFPKKVVPNYTQTNFSNQKEIQTNFHPYFNQHTNSLSSVGSLQKFSFQVEQQKQLTNNTQKKFENYVAKKKRQAQLKLIQKESVASDDILSGW